MPWSFHFNTCLTWRLDFLLVGLALVFSIQHLPDLAIGLPTCWSCPGLFTSTLARLGDWTSYLLVLPWSFHFNTCLTWRLDFLLVGLALVFSLQHLPDLAIGLPTCWSCPGLFTSTLARLGDWTSYLLVLPWSFHFNTCLTWRLDFLLPTCWSCPGLFTSTLARLGDWTSYLLVLPWSFHFNTCLTWRLDFLLFGLALVFSLQHLPDLAIGLTCWSCPGLFTSTLA